MPDKNEDNTHYVLHVRVEKIVTTPNTNLKAVTGSKNDRDIEDVVNIVKKAESLMGGIDFIKDVLDLTLNEYNPNKKAIDA
jgi:hypothetical protein